VEENALFINTVKVSLNEKLTETNENKRTVSKSTKT
jgi:hypothetical protein